MTPPDQLPAIVTHRALATSAAYIVPALIAAWCDNRGLSLTAIRPFDVAAWVKELQGQHGAQVLKQQLAAVRMLFDRLITGQIVPMTPATAVPGQARRQD